MNTIAKDEPVIAFKGIAKSVFQVPLSVSPEKGEMSVTVKNYNETAITVNTSDAATLHFSALTPNTAYTLSIDGKKQTMWTSYNGRSLEVVVPNGKHTVTLSQ